MILRIDTSSAVPVYAQIVDQIKRAIASGALRTGDPLPSLREMALKLRVNPLTVGKAYKQIEQEKLIETRHGLGSFVTAQAAGSVDDYRRDVLAQAMDYLLVDACHLRVSFDEVRRLLEDRIYAAENGFANSHNDEVKNNDE